MLEIDNLSFIPTKIKKKKPSCPSQTCLCYLQEAVRDIQQRETIIGYQGV